MSVFSLNELSGDKCYGVPDQKKFPLPDKKHVLSAIKFFNYVDEEHEKQLASNIKKKIKKYDMADKVNVGDNNRFKKYWNESVIEESVESKYLEKGDFTSRLDEWDPDGKNILYITGVSGSGKTTLAKDIAKLNNCQRVELDYIIGYNLKDNKRHKPQSYYYNELKKDCPIAVQFLDEHPFYSLDGWFNCEQITDDFLKWFQDKVKSDGNLYVVNGAQIIYATSFNPLGDITESPIIIKGVNAPKAVIRRTIRELDGVTSFPDIYRKFRKGMQLLINPAYLKSVKRYNDAARMINQQHESVELDAEVMKVYQYPLPSVMPYFTPDEMENMGVFSEDAEKNYYGVKTKNPYAKEWFDTYKATGDPGDNYLQKLLPVIDKKMKEPSYEHKQELLEWGWNPEIAFSEKVKPRMEQVREKILEQYGVTLVSLVEDTVDDPFKLAAVNIAKMLRENKNIIIANRAMKVTDNCNFTIYTFLDELKYSSKIHDGIIIGQIHYDSDIVKSDILSVAKAAIERTNEYLASKSQMYMIKDLIYDTDIAPENKQDIIFIKREMAGQTNIAESAKGGRTIEDDTPEVIDLTNKDQLDYNERNMLDSLDDMNDDIDNGISTIEGDKSTSDSNNELSND